MTAKMHRKWGYHPIEEDRIFELEEGGTLPEGWADRPVPKAAIEEPEVASDGSDWEALYVAADLRAKALEIEVASLKEELSALKSQPEKVEEAYGLPSDWRSKHHSTRIRIAKELAPEMAELILNAKDADEVLEKLEADLNGQDDQ